eukprot:gene21009-biopygen7079
MSRGGCSRRNRAGIEAWDRHDVRKTNGKR